MRCHLDTHKMRPATAQYDGSGTRSATDRSPLPPQLEQQALRKLEALQRWMEATDTRPDMQQLLAEALEDLRDVAMRLVGEAHARQKFQLEAAQLEVCGESESLEAVQGPLDQDEDLFDEGPRSPAQRSPFQALTFHQTSELPQALWEEGMIRSTAPLPVLIDEPDGLRRRARAHTLRAQPLPQQSLDLGHRRAARAGIPKSHPQLLELAASESGQIESARFVAIQGLEPGDVIGGPVETLEADEEPDVATPLGWLTSSPGLA